VLKEENNLDMIIALMEEKNEYLKVFLDVSEKERKSFKARNFDNIEDLYAVRESILENVRSLDRRIDKYSRGVSPDTLDPVGKEKIKGLMATKQSLVNKIMSQDLVMLACVENEKSNIIKKLTSVRDGRRLLKAYRFMPDIIE